MLADSGHDASHRPWERAARLAVPAVVLSAPAYAYAGPLELLSDPALDARATLIVGIFVGIIVFAVVAALLFLRAARRARRAEARARSRAGAYDRKTGFLKAVLDAEPQVLVHWNEAGDAAIVADTLGSDLGVPRDISGVLRFESWVERDCANELQSHVEALRNEGQGFNLMLKSKSGAHIEADGRAAGGGSVLKIRDLAGRRRELAEICEQHRQLGKENDRMRAFLDVLPMPVWFRGQNGSLQWVNRSYARAVSADGADQVYNQHMELLDAGTREAAERALARGDIFRGHLNIAAGNGEHSYDAIVLGDGRAQAGIAMDRDRPEAAGTEVSRHFNGHTRILDQISTAMINFSSEQKLTYFNKAFAELWDLDPEWLSGGPRDGEVLDRLRDQRRLPEQADYRDWKQQMLSVYETGERREDLWHLPDGRTLRVVAERGSGGGVTCLYEDITETLALKSRYNALIHVQKETLDHLGEGVAVFGSDGRLKLFNPSFAAIWDLDAGELEAEPHIDDVIARCQALLDDVAAWSELKAAVTGIDDERRQIEGQLERPDGVFLAYAGLPLPDGATLLTYVDISDTKRMENALIERNEALVAADRLKSAFISHVSYELRTPLTNIIGFSEFLQNPEIGPLNEKQQEYLGDIRSSSDTLLAIIDDILDLATIDAGGLSLKISPVTARQIIDAAVLGVRDRLHRANLDLNVRIAEDVAEFNADVKRMTQALYNLLSNAIGFSEPGGAISVECRREGDTVTFSVEDEGCGIPADYQQSVFDRFESRPQGSRHRGAGLGLAIVKSIMELHSGSVELLSTPHEGTIVTIRMPTEGPDQVREQLPPAAAE